MPRKIGGEFKPTSRQARLGVEEIVFSKPYKLKGSSNYVVDVYMSSPTGYTKIEGKSYGVARKLAQNYRIEVAHVQSAKRAEEITERYRTELFTSDVARSGILMENLAKEGGLAQLMKAGLQGHLSPKNQQAFDQLALMVAQISKDPALANEFYQDAKESFRIIGDKYKLFKSNSWAITEDEDYDPTDKRRPATMKDVKELEDALNRVLDMAKDYYAQRLERIDRGAMSMDMTDKIIIRELGKTSPEFIEGFSNIKGRMKYRGTKW